MERAAPPTTTILSDCCCLTSGELAQRRSFFGLSYVDDDNLDRVRFTIRDHVADLVNAFYEHAIDGAPGPLVGGSRALTGLRAALRDYLMTLGLDVGSHEYVEGRLQIGLLHERAGLDHTWFLGAHARLFELIAALLPQRVEASRVTAVLGSLQRVLAFDAHLGMEAHFRVHERWLEGRVDELCESQRQLVSTSRRDSLTQIDCRAFLLEALQDEFARSQRLQQDFSLLFIDVDQFKGINDAFGHAAGDAVLVTAAATIQRSVRPHDMVGRYGGDEFLVGLVQTDAATAEQVALRVCRMVREAPAGPAGLVTVSIGCCSRVGEEALTDLVQSADRAMYAAKARGKNQVGTRVAP